MIDFGRMKFPKSGEKLRKGIPLCCLVIFALGTVPSIAETPGHAVFPAAALRDRCVPVAAPMLADTTCRVVKSGLVPGGGRLFFQVQRYLDGGLVVGGGVAILAPAPGEKADWQVVIAKAEDDAAFEAPIFFTNRFGTFLDLGAYTKGTGQFPLGSLMRRQGDGWVEIDVQRWQAELAGRLPKGVTVWRGPYPDYPRLAASAVVRREPPSAGADPDVDYEGYAAIRLTITGDALALERVAWKVGSEGPCELMADFPGCGGTKSAK